MQNFIIENCIKKVNKFTLVILAAKRAKELSYGAKSNVNKEEKIMKEKNTTIALKEIAQNDIFDSIQPVINHTKNTQTQSYLL